MADQETPRTLVGLINFADNLSEPEPLINRREAILGLCIAPMVLSWICVVFRLYTRLKVLRSPWWDDLFVVLSVMTMSLGMIAICISTNTGMGKHIVLLTPDEIANFFHSFYVINGSYSMSTAFIKISLLLQFMRMYPRGTKLYSTCYYLVIFVGLWGLAYSLISWVPCVPVADYWEIIYKPLEETKCYGYGSQDVEIFKATYESHAAVNMVLDLLVMALPIPLYFQPEAHLKTKLGLVAVIVMGTIVNIFSVWRFATMIEHRATTYPTFDPTWYGPISIVMAGLETAAACICASVPIFWGPMLASASQLLGQIFVTQEVRVTSEDRFRALGSREQFQHDIEMQGSTLCRQQSGPSDNDGEWAGYGGPDEKKEKGVRQNITWIK